MNNNIILLFLVVLLLLILIYFNNKNTFSVNNKKLVILITHSSDENFLKRLKKMKDEFSGTNYKFVILYDDENRVPKDRFSNVISKFRKYGLLDIIHPMNKRGVIKSLGIDERTYKGWNWFSRFKKSPHLYPYAFIKMNNFQGVFSHFWILEDDIVFTGSFKKLFDQYDNNNTKNIDFLGNKNMVYKSHKPVDNQWHSVCNLYENPKDDQELFQTLQWSFRLSNKFMNYVLQKIMDPNNILECHHEVVLPLLANKGGFTSGIIDTIYNGELYQYKNIDPETLRNYQFQENKLYHPIKTNSEVYNMLKNTPVIKNYI